MSNLNYKLLNGLNFIMRLDNYVIFGPDKKEEWKEYQDWLKAGNKPVPADPLPEMPENFSGEPTIEQKLASVGLNLNDLKTALGIKE